MALSCLPCLFIIGHSVDYMQWQRDEGPRPAPPAPPATPGHLRGRRGKRDGQVGHRSNRPTGRARHPYPPPMPPPVMMTRLERRAIIIGNTTVLLLRQRLPSHGFALPTLRRDVGVSSQEDSMPSATGVEGIPAATKRSWGRARPIGHCTILASLQRRPSY